MQSSSTANPVISTAPAVAAPAGPRRSEAHAVPDVIARPTPTPATGQQEPAKTQEERKQSEQAQKKDEKWDVEAEHGPTSVVEFDTDDAQFGGAPDTGDE